MMHRGLFRAAFVLICAVVMARAVAAADAPLTNSAVEELSAALPEDVVVAKVRQAAQVQFQLDTEALLTLRKHGVKDAVIKAMLERSTPPPAPAMPPLSNLPPNVRSALAGVQLATSSGAQPLTGHYGEFSMSGFAFVQLSFLNIPGLHSPIRTTDGGASLVVVSDMDPATSSSFTIVRFDVDNRHKQRSVKVGRAMDMGFNSQSIYRPDEDWTFAFTTSNEGNGSYRITPTSRLKAGEYALLKDGVLYDFGVD